jgi:hypothetical protein
VVNSVGLGPVVPLTVNPYWININHTSVA